ncbi:MAG: TIGR01777 family protein [Chlorobiota bacterium]|nr:MAG: TIGR01777 family protein [Chlorobiota bacterium]
MRILVVGATGFLGRAVVEYFDKQGADVLAIVRDLGSARTLLGSTVQLVDWTVLDSSVLEGSDAVINFAGASIAKGRWTERRKRQLHSSRVEPTRRIVEVIAQCTRPPRVLLNASAVGYYGHRGDEILTERSTKGEGFLADLCAEWEAAACQAEPYCRVVRMRLGVVLGQGGGMLAQLVPIVSRLGAVIPGTGKQWVSWISQMDVSRATAWLIEQENISGAVNLVAPEPVTMETFMRSLAEFYHRPVWFRVPEVVLRLVLGQMATTLTDSTRAVPACLQQGGFDFHDGIISQFFAHSRTSS